MDPADCITLLRLWPPTGAWGPGCAAGLPCRLLCPAAWVLCAGEPSGSACRAQVTAGMHGPVSQRGLGGGGRAAGADMLMLGLQLWLCGTGAGAAGSAAGAELPVLGQQVRRRSPRDRKRPQVTWPCVEAVPTREDGPHELLVKVGPPLRQLDRLWPAAAPAQPATARAVRCMTHRCAGCRPRRCRAVVGVGQPPPSLRSAACLHCYMWGVCLAQPQASTNSDTSAVWDEAEPSRAEACTKPGRPHLMGMRSGGGGFCVCSAALRASALLTLRREAASDLWLPAGCGVGQLHMQEPPEPTWAGPGTAVLCAAGLHCQHGATAAPQQQVHMLSRAVHALMTHSSSRPRAEGSQHSGTEPALSAAAQDRAHYRRCS